MKIVAKKKGEGKTTELIELAYERNIYIVCSSTQDADRISKMARELGKRILYPITFNEFLQKRYESRNIDGFVFDDIDKILSDISSVRLIAMTMTIEEKDEEVYNDMLSPL